MKFRTGATLGFFLVLIASTWLLRWPGLATRFWNVDEAVTFTMAEQILGGELPYRDAVDQRNPLVPYLQAVVFSAAGDWNLRAEHVALTLLIGLTAVLLWRTARALGEEAVGAAGALWFTLLAFVLPSVRDTMPAHTAWYLIFFSTAGFWLFARAWTAERAGWAAASGAVFGLSFLAKQPGILDFGVALVLVALGFWRDPARRRKLAGLLGALLAGFAVPVAFTGSYFAAKGAWADLAYYAWTYNNQLYVPEIPLLERWQTVRVPFALAWEFNPLVVLAGGLAALALLRHALSGVFRQPRSLDLAAWLILGWCASGLISTTLSGRGFTHYSIQLIPGLSLACGWLCVRLWRLGWGGASAGRVRRTLVLAAAGVLTAALLQRLPARIRALDLPDPGSDIVTQLVRRNTGPRDRIFVWGYNPEIYALSERLPATRFLYCTFLTGLIPWTNLDPLKNTDYAVVPGAWDHFLADWQKHPPALVADGRGQRGFLKYKLDRQPRLWPLIERDYAQVEVEPAALHGFWMFRRLENSPPHPLPANLFAHDGMQIATEPVQAGQTARVAVHAPPGTQFLELYLDGRPYRRLPCVADTPVSASFFIPAADRTGSSQRVRAVALIPGGALTTPEIALAVKTAPAVIGGPPLDFAGRQVAALESSTITGGPILRKKEVPEHWDAHAPSRLVYPRLPGMNSLAFGFGIEEMALERKPPENTDGIEVVVQVEDEAGRNTQVYRRYFDPETARRTRGRAVDYTPLPPLTGPNDRIILLMTPGPQNVPVLDWSYWLWIRADPSPVALMADGTPRQPVRVEAPAGLRQAEFNGRFITVAKAPSLIEFPATSDLFELSGGFGLLDTAWLGPDPTGPVDFVVTLHQPDGGEKRLFERLLDPVNVAADRGVQSFHFALPQPMRGTLRFAARPRTSQGNSEAFWSQLSATLLRTSLRMHDEVIPALPETGGQFGLLNTDEGGRDCLVAHAPAALVYAWREDFGHLTGEYGMKAAAYLENDTEGVIFVVEAEDAKGVRRELFRRHLAPKTRAEDRGDQQLSVELPPLPGGRFYLRTLPAPSGHLNAAWSYWRDLRVDR